METEADRNAVEFADEEFIQIGGVETLGLMKAGIPGFRRRPFERELKVGFCHRAHNEKLVAHEA